MGYRVMIVMVNVRSHWAGGGGDDGNDDDDDDDGNDDGNDDDDDDDDDDVDDVYKWSAEHKARPAITHSASVLTLKRCSTCLAHKPEGKQIKPGLKHKSFSSEDEMCRLVDHCASGAPLTAFRDMICIRSEN
ncbi:LOW QUALITY PROTEIN: hypothetical protein ElyMa_000341400 [Elysia marginata]|uniref:Uncharacterized protein n=1 Tax=Elysia marginata TaxID=1093978 RepID=A0AAV4FDZ5_9GAST|nr:LOW QUALITY PROTEIN: hypothetical protein ElyMa_000341400 [Elysia marginata]